MLNLINWKEGTLMVKNTNEKTEIVKELKVGTSQFSTGYKNLQKFYQDIQEGTNEKEINKFIQEKFFSRRLDKTVKLEQMKFDEYLRIKIGGLRDSLQVISKEITGDSGLEIKKMVGKTSQLILLF